MKYSCTIVEQCWLSKVIRLDVIDMRGQANTAQRRVTARGTYQGKLNVRNVANDDISSGYRMVKYCSI